MKISRLSRNCKIGSFETVLVVMACTMLFGTACASMRSAQSDRSYLPGGPLAGEELPLFPTQHGEPFGHPGSIPDLAAESRQADPDSTAYTPQGQYPQRLLYDGSVEHFRAYWDKYSPVRHMADRMSLVRNFVAAELPGMEQFVEEYAEPVYWVSRHGSGEDTGFKHAPVKVVRTTVDGPKFDLELGELDRGLYVVRVIGAVEGEYLQQFRLPLYIRLTINDGVDGSENHYRQRIGYVDQFYSVSEIYFHAPETRVYRASVCVDRGSQPPLLVHNIDVHDMLAGAERRAIKQETTLTSPEELQEIRRRAEEEGVRAPFGVTSILNSILAAHDPEHVELGYAEYRTLESETEKRRWLDDFIWRSLPPINSQPSGSYGRGRSGFFGGGGYHPQVRFGADGKSPAEIEAEHGQWGPPPLHRGWHSRHFIGPVLIVNAKLGLTYTTDDLAQGRPLPDPYPYKDDGAGLYYPASEDDEDGRARNFTLVADAVNAHYSNFQSMMNSLADYYHKTGNAQAGRDAAMMLIRLAYQQPARHMGHELSKVVSVLADWDRDMRFRQREMRPIGIPHLDAIEAYDKLFDLIQGNQELARSVGEFIPWVNTPEDLIELLDVYLVQDVAKRILRYQLYSSNVPTRILTPVMALNDNRVTGPWMDWLFRRTFIYPNALSGLNDLIITSHDRDGRGYIASTSYAQGQEASGDGELLGRYVDSGGDSQYDFRDRDRYPKVTESTYWPLRIRMAGLHWPRMGSVGGPEKSYEYLFDGIFPFARRGWRWTRDPDFAFILTHYAGRENETDAEWAQVEEAARSVTRAPWLENRSRMLPNWMGVLETGIEHDDFRFRRAAMLRIGQGWGHHHNDTLDLQLMAQGYPMTVDGGQRPAYSRPHDRHTRTHNLVEVDGQQWLGHSWINTISDGPGARFMSAQAVPPHNHQDNVTFYRRQLALVDVDEGSGSQSLEPAQLTPGAKLNTEGIVPANSYIVDFVRVEGGRQHTYMFHGPVDDQLDVNLERRVTGDDIPDAERGYLGLFRGLDESFAADAPDTVQATWRMSREDVRGNEQRMVSGIWNADSPRKYTRLHVLGQGGARVMHAPWKCHQLGYTLNRLFVQHTHDEQRGMVFPAVIEPYAGNPFIIKTGLIHIPNNEDDAYKAVALEVETVNGHRDIIFTDGRPAGMREVGNLRISGEFAFYSTDESGLRLAGLTGGAALEAADVVIKPDLRERTGEVIEVDYLNRQMVVDSADWPRGGQLAEQVFEIGTREPSRMTAYTLTGIEHDRRGSVLKVLRGADFYLARVKNVDSEAQIVECALGLPVNETRPSRGMDKNWVASNEAGTKFWRADYLGRKDDDGGYLFQLDGAVSENDFEDYGAFRLWEYGVGDHVRQSTFVNLRRVEKGVFEITANVSFTLALDTEKIEIGDGERTWQTLSSETQDGLQQVRVELEQLDGDGKALIRIQ